MILFYVINFLYCNSHSLINLNLSFKGKLPAAFYRIEDPEARIFVGKCLQVASKRPSAKDLVSEPFLLSQGELLRPARHLEHLQPFLGVTDTEMESLRLVDNAHRTKMTITGKLNPEDDTIFLRVQISEEQGMELLS